MSYTAARARQEAKNDDGGNQSLMCSARNCPNLWSIESSNHARLCRWHADVRPHRWPEVTRDMNDYLTNKAQRAGFDKPATPPLTKAEKIAIL